MLSSVLVRRSPLRFPFKGKVPLLVGKSAFASCCCGGGAGIPPTGIDYSCENVTGSGLLYGFSAYDDGSYNSGDPAAWPHQFRKWKNLQITGRKTLKAYSSASCDSLYCTYQFKETYSGITTLEEVNGVNTVTTFTKVTQKTWNGRCSDLDDPDTITEGNVTSLYHPPGSIVTPSSVRVVRYECLPDTNPFNSYESLQYDEDFTQTLSNEIDPFSALVAQGGVVSLGNGGCVSSLTSGDMTYPESTDPIGITGTVARSRINVKGGTPGTSWPAIATFVQDGVVFEKQFYVTAGQVNFFTPPLPDAGEPGVYILSLRLA